MFTDSVCGRCRGLLLQVLGGSDSGVSLLKGMVLSRMSRMHSAVVEEGLGFLLTGETTLSLLSVEPKPMSTPFLILPFFPAPFLLSCVS